METKDKFSFMGKSILIRRARALRRSMTPHETFLWSRMRLWRDAGLRFRRQAPFRSYILDFVCHRSKVVVEVDGSQHADPGHQQADARRDQILFDEGYLVIRVWNRDLRLEADHVLSNIFDQSQARLSMKDRPTP
ncbi:MAG: endonuclease domain-containing protein [Oceanicaulis sp.]